MCTQQKAIFSVNFIAVEIKFWKKSGEVFCKFISHFYALNWPTVKSGSGQLSKKCLFKSQLQKGVSHKCWRIFFITSRWWWPVNLERLLLWRRLYSRCDHLAFEWIICLITWTPGGPGSILDHLYAKTSSHTIFWTHVEAHALFPMSVWLFLG